MEIADHISTIAQEGKLFAAAAQKTRPDTGIPTCPDWDMRDLVRHLSEIHLWAAARVAKRTDGLWLDDLSELSESWPELAVFWPEDKTWQIGISLPMPTWSTPSSRHRRISSARRSCPRPPRLRCGRADRRTRRQCTASMPRTPPARPQVSIR